MIKVGDTLPSATLMEYSEVEGNGCSIGPNPVDVRQASAGNSVAAHGSACRASQAAGPASGTAARRPSHWASLR